MEVNYIIIILGIILLVVLVFLFKIIFQVRSFKKKYSAIINIDIEVEARDKEKNRIEKEIEELRSSYKEKRVIYDNLIRQIALYDEEIELAELGFYKPHFDFDTSENFKDAIQNCKEKQKNMVKNKKAVYCAQQWTVDGSKSKGTTMTNRNIRLTSRAFNSECDAVIANVRWNNVVRFEERLIKAHEAIDKMNASNKIYNSEKYLKLKMAMLEQELMKAHEKNERAKSLAELTKAGHIYIISNIGSFGEKVYKIGMTRRLDPMDRVKELGDASVPFIFDVHAMIYSEDAPLLENALHSRFKDQRLNLVNNRKEFFNISLENIEEEVHKVFPDSEFVVTSEAREFRESEAIRSQREHKLEYADITIPLSI